MKRNDIQIIKNESNINFLSSKNNNIQIIINQIMYVCI